MRAGIHIAFLFGGYLIVEAKYPEIDDEVTKMERGMEPNEDDVHFYLFTRSETNFMLISLLYPHYFPSLDSITINIYFPSLDSITINIYIFLPSTQSQLIYIFSFPRLNHN